MPVFELLTLMLSLVLPCEGGAVLQTALEELLSAFVAPLLHV